MGIAAKILLVEADEDWSKLIHQLLKPYDLMIVSNVEQALDALNDNNFDCQILNLNLPTHNGIELLNERAGYRDLLLIPTIVYSAWPELGEVSQSTWRAYGISAWLKQTELTKLPDKLAEVLENAPDHD